MRFTAPNNRVHAITATHENKHVHRMTNFSLYLVCAYGVHCASRSSCGAVRSLPVDARSGHVAITMVTTTTRHSIARSPPLTHYPYSTAATDEQERTAPSSTAHAVATSIRCHPHAARHRWSRACGAWRSRHIHSQHARSSPIHEVLHSIVNR
jgi:hypothetical protein